MFKQQLQNNSKINKNDMQKYYDKLTKLCLEQSINCDKQFIWTYLKIEENKFDIPLEILNEICEKFVIENKMFLFKHIWKEIRFIHISWNENASNAYDEVKIFFRENITIDVDYIYSTCGHRSRNGERSSCVDYDESDMNIIYAEKCIFLDKVIFDDGHIIQSDSDVRYNDNEAEVYFEMKNYIKNRIQ